MSDEIQTPATMDGSEPTGQGFMALVHRASGGVSMILGPYPTPRKLMEVVALNVDVGCEYRIVVYPGNRFVSIAEL